MRPLRSLLPALVTVSAISFAGAAAAQAPPPPPPPPATPQPPPGPPPGYQVQPAAPGYGVGPGYPPPGYPQQLGGYYGTPLTMDYEDGQPVPQGYHVESKIRKGMVIAGAATFGAFYIISALTGVMGNALESAFGDKKESWAPLYIPIAGPFVAMGTLKPNSSGAFGLAFLGVGQVAGAALLIGGLVATSDKLVRNDVGKTKLTVVPLLAKGTQGLGVIGTF